MKSIVKPDKFFVSILDIDIKTDILDKGVKSILLDIDNTIMPRDTHIIPDTIINYIEMLKKNKIKICLISNDWHSYVLNASKVLNVPIVVKACKPCPIAYTRALKKISAKRKTTLSIGDQLLTDVLGARLTGLRTYLVLPLVKQDLKHTLFLRKIEKFFISNLTPSKKEGYDNEKM